MSAKDMFEKSGYKQVDIGFNNIIHYEKLEDKRLNWSLAIEFVLNHEFVSLISKFGEYQYGAFNGLTINLLQAINKQVEELGWNNVNTTN